MIFLNVYTFWAAKAHQHSIFCELCTPKASPDMIRTLFGGQRHASTFMLMRFLSPQNQPRHDFDPVWARKRASTFMLMCILGRKSPPRHDFESLLRPQNSQRASTFVWMRALGAKDMILTAFGASTHPLTFMVMHVLSPQNKPRHDLTPFGIQNAHQHKC